MSSWNYYRVTVAFFILSIPPSSTPLHVAVTSNNIPVFNALLEEDNLNLELQNADNQTALWLALQVEPPGDQFENDSFASRLINRGSSPNAVDKETGLFNGVLLEPCF